MQYLRLFVEYLADAVATEFADYAVAGFFSVLLDHIADIAQMRARFDLGNAQPHALVGDVAQAFGHDRRFADVEHAAGVAVIAVLDYGDVEIYDVAVFQYLVARDAVADDVIDRCADGFRIGRIARRTIIQRSRDGILHICHVFVAQAVQLAGGDADFDKGRDVIEYFRSKPAGNAHAGNVFSSFYGDRGHRIGKSRKFGEFFSKRRSK